MYRTHLLVFLFLAAVLGACDTMSSLGDDALNLVGLGSSDSSSGGKSKKSSKKDPDQKNTTAEKTTDPEPDSGTEKNDPTGVEDPGKDGGSPAKPEIVRNTQTLTQKAQKKDLKKSAVAPPFREDAPVFILRRIGGAARFMTADDRYVYLDFPQYFAVYDAELNPLAKLPVSYPVVSVRRETLDNRTLLYLQEENNALEILELQAPGDGTAKLIKLDAYDMGGTFRILDARHVVNFDKDKLEIWDFSDVQKAKIDRELPVGEGDDIFMAGGSIFLSRHGFLDVLRAEDYSLQSTLRLNRRFGFIGVMKSGEKNLLVLSLLSPDGALQGIQTLVLTSDQSGVQDFDRTVVFDIPLNRYSVDLEKGLFLGQEVMPDKKTQGLIRIFSFKNGRGLRGKISDMTDLQAWALAQGRLYLATGLQISINEVELSQEIISKADLVKLVSGNKPANPPLAQIGAPSDVKDEYVIRQIKSLLFMSDSRRVSVWDRDHVAIMEMSADRRSHRLYASANLSSEDFSLKEINSAESVLYGKTLWSDIGWFLLTQDRAKVHLLDLGFEKITALPLPVLQKFVSWHWFTPDGNEEYLVLAEEKGGGTAPKVPSKSKTGSSKKPSTSTEISIAPPDVPRPYALSLYHLISPEKMELDSQLHFAEKPFALVDSEGVLLVVTASGLVRYDIADPKAPRWIEDEGASVSFTQKYDIIDVRISPRNDGNPLADRVFLLVREADILKIVVFNAAHADQRVVMEDFIIQESQFEGMTIADEGRLMILPTDDGTIFYDITDLTDRTEKSFWPLSAEFVGMTDDGTFICTALGSKGVYCGNLLF